MRRAPDLFSPPPLWSCPIRMAIWSYVFADPTKVETIKAFGQELPLAMDLEAWLDQVEATGPPPVAGVRQMLRPEKFEGRSRLTFLQPFDPDKIPVLLIHGLMSTPRMWKPVLDRPPG